jgi:ABC-type Zn uptake system ZnuABC Zn-binding protein ZnuA
MKTSNSWFALFVAISIVVGCFDGAFANKKINVVTTLPVFKDIAERIGGDKVQVEALAKGYQDPHFVDAKPSFIVKMNQADLFIWAGLDLEVGWAPPLVEGARNAKILWGAVGNLDVSKGIPLLEIPQVAAAQLRAGGDLHVYGNPHYWLDPERGKIIAQNIYERLAQLSPAKQAYFKANFDRFKWELDKKIAEWLKKLEPYRGKKIVAYHNSWPYFEERFGLEIVDFIEPKPGIPPSPAHLVSVIQTMKQLNIKVIIIEPYYDNKPAQSVASRTDAVVVPIATSVEAYKDIQSYFDLFDYNVNALVEAFKQKAE